MVVSCDSAGGEKRIVDQDFARGEKRIVDQDSARGGTARAILCAPQALLPKTFPLLSLLSFVPLYFIPIVVFLVAILRFQHDLEKLAKGLLVNLQYDNYKRFSEEEVAFNLVTSSC